MHPLSKAAACLTITCLLWPQPAAWADEQPAASGLAMLYRSQVVINTTPYSPASQPLSIGGQLYLPIQMEVVTYKEKEVFERTLTREEQLLEARGKIGRFAEQKLQGMEVLDSHESVVDNGDSITVRITYDCVEDIGERVRIYPADMPEQQPAA